MEDNISNFKNKIQNTVNKVTLPCVINLIEKTQDLKREKKKIKKNFISLKQMDQILIGKETKINQLKGFINKINEENKNLKTKEDAINQYILKIDKKEKKLENEQSDYLNIEKEINSINLEQTIITHILGNENKKDNNLKIIKNENSIMKNPLVKNTKKKRRFKSFNNKLEINNSPNVFQNHKSLKSSLNLNQCSLNDGEILNKYSERKKKTKKHNSYQKNKSLTISSKVLNNENSFDDDTSNNSLKGNKNKTISSPKFKNNTINNNGRDKYRNLHKYLSNGKKKYSTTTNISLPSKQFKYNTKNSDSSINSSIVVNKNKKNSRSVEKEFKEKLNLNIKSPSSKKNIIKNNNKLHKNKSVDTTKKIDISNEDIYIKTYKNKKNNNHLKTDIDFNQKNNKYKGKKLKTVSNLRSSSIEKEKELKLSPKKTIQTITVSIHNEKNNNNNKNKIHSQRGIPKIKNNNILKNNKDDKNNKINNKNNSYEKKKGIKKQNNKFQKTKILNLLFSVFKKIIVRKKKEFLCILKLKKKEKKKIEINKIKQIIKKYYILILIKEINFFLNSKKITENENLKNKIEESMIHEKENINLNSNTEKINNSEIKIFEDKDLNIILNNYLSENGINGKNIPIQYDSKKYLESLNQIKNIAEETKNIEKNIQNFLLKMEEEKEISSN